MTGGSAKKPRTATPAKTQSNTLDSWFKKAAAPKTDKPAAAADAARSGTESESSSSVDNIAATARSNATSSSRSNGDSVATSTEAATELTSVNPVVEKKKAADSGSASSAKKLVQRRIHINDPCRVCDAARTEESSRCELRCLGCDMTVHKVRSCDAVERVT